MIVHYDQVTKPLIVSGYVLIRYFIIVHYDQVTKAHLLDEADKLK